MRRDKVWRTTCRLVVLRHTSAALDIHDATLYGVGNASLHWLFSRLFSRCSHSEQFQNPREASILGRGERTAVHLQWYYQGAISSCELGKVNFRMNAFMGFKTGSPNVLSVPRCPMLLAYAAVKCKCCDMSCSGGYLHIMYVRIHSTIIAVWCEV